MNKKLDNQTSDKRGFTMIELSLVMAFIAFLLIAIAIITTNIVTIYQKGSTLKAVNSVGRGLVDEFTAAINQAPSVDTTSLCNSLVSGEENVKRCIEDGAFKFIFQAEYAPNAADDNNIRKQYNGIFCTGYYSYYWNTEYGEESGNTVKLRYAVNSSDDGKDKRHEFKDNDEEKRDVIRLARIEDRTYQLCAANVNRNYESEYSKNLQDNDGFIDIRSKRHDSTDTVPIDNFIKPPEEGFLSAFDLDLALYELTIFPISQDWVTLRTFMSGSFVLATYRGNVDITRGGDYCDVSIYQNADGEDVDNASSKDNLGAEFNYCAINKFNFSTRTAGSGV